LNSVPDVRIREANTAPVDHRGDFVLYWMTAYRRTNWNFSLDRAMDWARKLDKPLVILEALRCGYRWASDRLHGFILEGMADNARNLSNRPVLYYPFVERRPDEGKGLLYALSRKACVIVTDDFPAFFIPRMAASASKKIPVRMELVDSNGILPMRAADRVFTTAYSFRRFLQKKLPEHLYVHPKSIPFKGARLRHTYSLPKEITRRWPSAERILLQGNPFDFSAIPLNHSVGPVPLRGGLDRAKRLVREFLKTRISDYTDKRNQPEEAVTSGLSPYLHFGHISVHEVFSRLTKIEGWFLDRLSPTANGRRSGWWGMREPAEAFLDQIITWRELGFNMCWQREDYQAYESLPEWARETLKAHEKDMRPYLYTLEQFEAADTHDELWNAAQTQLCREGTIHNYLRMLWGKKILEWSENPSQALDIMIELNNKYALDGRDPNSYSGIFWVLGRYDRAWGPERPIFGKIRYMSSENTRRKFSVQNYIARYA
jgi:deoxyribodipyrimidine photo-lyase